MKTLTTRAVSGLASAALLAALAVGAQGCSESSSGRVAGSGDDPNFIVTNHHVERIHLYVDGASIGDVGPGATEEFVIRSGFRRLELRESGSSVREWQGDYSFSSTDLSFSYDPTVGENLRVTNNGPEAVEVYVAGDYIGEVSVGQTRNWLIDSGRWEVHVREDGDIDFDYLGEFNFNTSELVVLTYD